MPYFVAFILFVVGSFIGLSFPDSDQAFHWQPLLLHRSLLTHSFLAPLLLLYALGVGRKGAPVAARWFILGLLLATAVHLCFDLVVARWTGYALIHVPFYGWTTPLFSMFSLALSAFVCLFIACLLLQNLNELYLAVGGLVVCYGVSAAKQPSLSFWALFWLLLLALVATAIARARHRMDMARR